MGKMIHIAARVAWARSDQKGIIAQIGKTDGQFILRKMLLKGETINHPVSMQRFRLDEDKFERLRADIGLSHRRTFKVVRIVTVRML